MLLYCACINVVIVTASRDASPHSFTYRVPAPSCSYCGSILVVKCRYNVYVIEKA